MNDEDAVFKDTQLAEYLAIRGLDEGYHFTGNRIPRQPEWILQDGKRIFEVII